MDKKQMERIAHHYLGERLIRVEHTPDNKPPFQVVYDSGCSVCYDGMYGNNVEEMCIRIAAEIKSRGWVPTHERLEWSPPSDGRRGWHLHLLIGKAPARCLIAMVGPSTMLFWGDATNQHLPPQEVFTGYIDCRERVKTVYYKTMQDAAQSVAEWVAENLPYYLPTFPETER